MESWEIKGRTLEYFDDTHMYLVDGILVQSVTQLLNRKFGKKYDGIDANTLKKAADRGTRIHKAIEDYCKDGIESDLEEVKDFAFLQKYYKFEVVENELPIIVDFAGETYAGRLDLIIRFPRDEKDDYARLAVADIKTTSTLDKEYLGHQLNLYRMGVHQCYGDYITDLYGVHLRKGTRKLVEIPIRSEEWLAKSLNIPGV